MSRAGSAGTRRVVGRSRGGPRSGSASSTDTGGLTPMPSTSTTSQPNMMTMLSQGNDEFAAPVHTRSSRPSSSRPTSSRSRPMRQSSASEGGGMVRLSGPPMAEKTQELQSAEDKALARAMEKIQRLDVKLSELRAREKDVKRQATVSGHTGVDANEPESDEDVEEDGTSGAGFFTTQPPESVASDSDTETAASMDDASSTTTSSSSVRQGKASKGRTKKGAKGGADAHKQDAIQRNIKLAADGGAGVLAMTPEEKERLNQLLEDLDSVDDSVAAMEGSISSDAPNPFRLDQAMDQLSEIDKRLSVMTKGRQSVASSARASQVPTETAALFNRQSKVKEVIRNEDDEARAHLAAIDSEIARLRQPPSDVDEIDERTMELLMMEGQAEQAYYEQVDANAAQLHFQVDLDRLQQQQQRQEEEEEEESQRHDARAVASHAEDGTAARDGSISDSKAGNDTTPGSSSP